MNKQEINERLKENGTWCAECNTGEIDRYVKIMKAMELVGQLDEPQKPVVPKFVAEWFEENKDKLEFEIWSLCVDSYNAEDGQVMFDWIKCSENNPIETLIRMRDGYEIEKEPLYTVELPSMTPSKLAFDEDYCKYKIVGDYTVGRLRHHLTEKEIKYFDERYWAFAVPVKEV